MKSYRIVFMGTPEFAVPAFEALCDAGHAVVAAVTQPDRPAGRGLQPTPPAVKTAALRRGVPVQQPATLRHPEAVEAIRALEPDFLVVAAYGEILSRAVLAIPAVAPLNVHASLLPRLRGASPIHHAILAGDPETGITIMRIARKLDAGDILLQAREPIGPRDTAGTLHDRLARIGAACIVQALERFERGEAAFTPQDDALSTYAPQLTREMGRLDWSRTADELDRFVRGLNPWPAAFTLFRGETVKVWEAAPLGGPGATPPPGLPDGPASPGELLPRGDHLLVVCAEGTCLEILRLQLPGRRAVTGAEFARGARVAPGERFGG
ncbi:MAG: methionyl-tRNA formyltransferase [Acidobacteria bacterium]|nr:methionyl-tRNA formyltransferase [Acidobacteriota bacterium]